MALSPDEAAVVGLLLVSWLFLILFLLLRRAPKTQPVPKAPQREAIHVPIDPTLLADLAKDAVEIGVDDHATHFYRIRRTPEMLLQDLRYAGKTEITTAWQSPRFRALLMANEGYGILALFTNRIRYEEAVRQAERGRFPEPTLELER